MHFSCIRCISFYNFIQQQSCKNKLFWLCQRHCFYNLKALFGNFLFLFGYFDYFRSFFYNFGIICIVCRFSPKKRQFHRNINYPLDFHCSIHQSRVDVGWDSILLKYIMHENILHIKNDIADFCVVFNLAQNIDCVLKITLYQPRKHSSSALEFLMRILCRNKI